MQSSTTTGPGSTGTGIGTGGSAQQRVSAAIERQRAGTLQYLTFHLGGLEYALDFSKVQELRPLQALERFASDGAILSGVALSRGVIMPIVDMRIAFGSRAAQHDPHTDVIILKLSTCVMGMVVDDVTDIVTLAPEQIAPIPGASAGEAVDYLLGLGAVNGRRLIVIDIDRLMSIRKITLGSRQAA